MTKAMPFLQKVILLSYDPRPFGGGAFFVQSRKKPARRQKSRRAGCGMSRYSHNR